MLKAFQSSDERGPKVETTLAPTQFGDAPSSLISIKSTPRIIPTKHDAHCQIESFTYSHQTTQCPVTSEIPIQTDISSFEGLLSGRHVGGIKNEEAERVKLEGFLSKVESFISQQLLQNLKSTAFNDYTVNWEDEVDTITCVHPIAQKERDPDHVCTDISWSKTGTTVAISYGRYDHESLCFHKGSICIWSLRARDFNPESAFFSATSSSCLMTCAFHPEIPSLIAGGAANGDVMVWSTLSQENALVACTTMDDISHQEPISKLIWIPGQRHQKYNLLSAATDGKIIIWSLENDSLVPLSMTRLAVAHIPASLKQSNAKSNIPLGIMSMVSCPHNRNEVIVGTETGYVFRVNLVAFSVIPPKKPSGTKSIFDSGANNEIFPNPVTFCYAIHSGPVQSISYNPSHRHLFVTCGSDGFVRLYHALQSKPLMVWEPNPGHAMTSISWSPFRPTVFSAVSSTGLLFIYDLTKSQATPSISMSSTSKQGIASTFVTFNPLISEWMATADAEGILRIWRVSSHLQIGDIARDVQLVQQLGSLETVFS